MATVITDNKNYSDIAAAIRTKNGESTSYKPSEMAAAIEAIKTGAENVVEFTAPKGRMKGDVDGDGFITEEDEIAVLAHVTHEETITDTVQLWCADTKITNSINNIDVTNLYYHLMGTRNIFVNAVDAGVNPDYYNNWTFYKIDSLNGYFYYDVSVSGMTASSSAFLLASDYSDCFIGVECMEGIARVKAERLPLEDTECLLVWEADGTEWEITKETAKGVFPNGTAWTQSNITDARFKCVYYANGIWVAGHYSSGGLYYSVDGKTWTASNITNKTVRVVYNANGIWVVGVSSNGLYYSADGKTWTQSNITSGTFITVYYANGIWVASSTAGLYYSTDGKTWTISNIADGSFACVHNANGIWVAGSSDENGLYYSTDGKTWTQSNITSGLFNMSIYNGNGIWVACCFDNTPCYSTDGKTWTACSISSYSTSGIYYANGIWVIGSYEDAGLYYSTDGKTWTQSNITSGDFQTIYNANGIWVAGSNLNGLYYSVDGKTWTQSNVVSAYGYQVYNANGLWVAATRTGLYYSVGWET